MINTNPSNPPIKVSEFINSIKFSFLFDKILSLAVCFASFTRNKNNDKEIDGSMDIEKFEL